MYDLHRGASSLLAVFLILVLAGCESSSGQVNDAVDADATCGLPASEAAPIPVRCVSFIESPAPNSLPTNLEPWLEKGCTQMHPTSPGYLECPELKTTYACPFLSSLGPLAAWLDQQTSAILCVSCQTEPDRQYCFCPDGLDQHSFGQGGLGCDYLFLEDGESTLAIRTPAELAARFAPVDDPAEALAFVALVGNNVKHLFTSEEFGTAATRVPGREEITYESLCSVDEVRATSVQADGTGFLVSTFQIPDYSGCSEDALTAVTYRVTSGGDVLLQSSAVICTAEIPCYD